ncbi:hypothetical protein RIEGSTA812A_PEG_350 [invertebrate metagenome]|uniref:Uncharacterized protein n=1 Tax=invertebrate metagenome TaxID=1711999 RepID=A0A484H4Y5_9ZZZZ
MLLVSVVWAMQYFLSGLYLFWVSWLVIGGIPFSHAVLIVAAIEMQVM